MVLPLWGQLEKAQDDDTTIAEFIAEQIVAHNEDSDSHLGSGESLESHKTETVIDHPAGSLLADKTTMTEFAVRSVFESLDGWHTLGIVSNDDIPGAFLYIETGEVEQSRVYTNPQIPKNYLNTGKNMVFQALIHYSLSDTDYESYFGIFSGTDISPDGFGFIVDGGTLKAYAKQSTNIEISGAVTVTLSDDNLFRAYLDSALETITYFLNGVEVAEFDISAFTWADDTGPSMWIKNTGANDGFMRIGELYYSREI